MQSVEFGPDDGIYTGIVGMDPAAEWLLGPGIQDYLPDGVDMLIPIIMKLNDQEGIQFILDLITAQSPIFIPPVYARNLTPGTYFTAFTTKAFFDELADPEGDFGSFRDAPKEIKLGASLKISKLSNWEPGQPNAPLDDPPIGPPAHGGWPPETVVIGIIDDGIAFGHERFRTKDHGSRVQCFWRQDPPNTSTTVELGHEICKQDASSSEPGIDTLLSSSTVAGAVDEDGFYRGAKLIDFADPGHKGAAWRVAHGTHVLDLAAGADPGVNVVNRPIIGVQLPAATTAGTSGGAHFKGRVLRAVDYILERADALAGAAGQLPVVINFSYGLIAGPHDGTWDLEQELDARIQGRAGKLRIVLPAGNSHLSRCHAEVKFTPVEPDVALHWRVQPDDRTPSWLEIWLPHAGAQPPSPPGRITLSIDTPGGAVSTPPIGEVHNAGVVVINNGEIICEARYVFEAGATQRGYFRVTLQPTARLQPTTPPVANRIAPSGVWTIKLHNVLLGAAQSVQIWIQRDDTAHGYPIRGRQSYFDQPCYVRFDAQGRVIEEDTPAQVASPCHVKRLSLINSIATGAETIVVGGFLRKDYRPARYSAGGPITPTAGTAPDPNLRKPDALAVSEDSKVHAGVFAAGSRSGSVVAMNGTSVAAPQIARWIADHLDPVTGNLPGRLEVKAEAIAQEAAPPHPKPPLPPDRGGWGRIDQAPVAPLERAKSGFEP